MADSTGVNALTGARMSDWDHVQQSIKIILSTQIGSRVMRRDFGSHLPDLIDAKMVHRNILAIYSAAATAINRWEPRFRVKYGSIKTADESGVVEVEITGTYFPRGHKGDYSVAEDKSTRVVFNDQ
jgi:uncharacterized protein